jgi:hypothetical protein
MLTVPTLPVDVLPLQGKILPKARGRGERNGEERAVRRLHRDLQKKPRSFHRQHRQFAPPVSHTNLASLSVSSRCSRATRLVAQTLGKHVGAMRLCQNDHKTSLTLLDIVDPAGKTDGDTVSDTLI